MLRFVNGLTLALALSLSVSAVGTARADTPFELRHGDRVVMIGDAFLEHDYHFGFLEMALTTRYADRTITFRNLGWSGDTVHADSRGYFGEAKEGFKYLREDIDEIKPTAAIICYGRTESFGGKAGLASFEKGYDKLLDMLGKHVKADRIVLLTPPPHEKLGPPYPDPATHNANIRVYGDTAKAIAKRRGHACIDLYKPIAELFAGKHAPLTQNGLHFTEGGYEAVAHAMFHLFTGPTPSMDIPDDAPRKLREMIVEKNALFFHRWRPANVTYLYLFRKHEQGNNAKEIPRLDPLIKQKERAIRAYLDGMLKKGGAK